MQRSLLHASGRRIPTTCVYIRTGLIRYPYAFRSSRSYLPVLPRSSAYATQSTAILGRQTSDDVYFPPVHRQPPRKKQLSDDGSRSHRSPPREPASSRSNRSGTRNIVARGVSNKKGNQKFKQEERSRIHFKSSKHEATKTNPRQPSPRTQDAHLYLEKREILSQFGLRSDDEKYSRLIDSPLEFLLDTGRFDKVSIFGTANPSRAGKVVHHVRATGKMHLDGEAITFVGYGLGVSQKAAQSAAWLHVAGLIHQRVGLDEFMSTSYNVKEITEAVLKKEKDSKMEVYEYCAAYNGIPEFKYRRIPRNRSYEITVSFPPQDIKVMVRHRDAPTGDTLASLLFKKQAELWHAKNADSNLQVKNILSLNASNARQFFDLCKLERVINSYELNRPEDRSANIKTLHAFQVLVDGKPLGNVAYAGARKSAENLAYLSAGVRLRESHPEVFNKFVLALKAGKGEFLKPIHPLWFRTRWEYLQPMVETVNSARRIGIPREYSKTSKTESDESSESVRSFASSSPNPEAMKARNLLLSQDLERYLEEESLQTLRRNRAALPMNQFAAKVLELVKQNSVSIIIGATGSGKTTQVPQIVFEDAIKSGNGASCNILCTQPRRIAATSVAERVAFERNEALRNTIGYHVRFNIKTAPPFGSINFCTTGILLQQLRHDPERALRGITHIIIDEVHERDVQIDFLMVLLKRVMRQRAANNLKPIKLVLMSATMNTELFAKYFASIGPNGHLVDCPSLSVPGRTFPVTEYFLDDVLKILRSNYTSSDLGLLKDKDTVDFLEVESQFKNQVLSLRQKLGGTTPSSINSEDDNFIDWKRKSIVGEDGEIVASNDREEGLIPCGLVATVVAHLAMTTTEGDILVFLPGLAEIQIVDEMLKKRNPLGMRFEASERYRIDILHSSLPQQQMDVFQTDTMGKRRIILSTNIAETSVTIPEVRYVIDSGKLREKRYEQTSRITKLQCTWVSKSNSKQRAGRAGRVRNGNYFALFSKERSEEFRPSGLPEILRSDLQEVCLDIRAQGFKEPIVEFLSEAIEPPSTVAIESALSQLRGLGALDNDDYLTNLGQVLATLPVEPSLGKMILLGVIFQCLDPMIILGAWGGSRDIFITPLERKREAQARKAYFAGETASDHFAVLNAFKEWRMRRDNEGAFALARFTDENYLHRGALRVLDQTANQIEELLVTAGIIPYCAPNKKAKGEYGHPTFNENSSSIPLIKALSLAGTYPNVGVVTGGLGLRTMEDNFVMIHPGSVNYTGRSGKPALPRDSIVSFGSKAKSSDGNSIYMRDVTLSSILNTMLFGGKPTQTGNTLLFDGWIPVSISDERTMKVVVQFRLVLDKVLNHAFQNISIRKPGHELRQGDADDKLRNIVSSGVVEVLSKYAQYQEQFDIAASRHRLFKSAGKTATPQQRSFKPAGDTATLQHRSFKQTRLSSLHSQ